MMLILMDVSIAMIKFKKNGVTLNINKDVIDGILKFKQTESNLESGGFLIGSIHKDGSTIDINDYTTPLAEDKRFRLWFNRSKNHNDILYDKWEKSNYTKLYLGEWHTHPQKYPTPSNTDIATWHKLLVKSRTESKIIVFIIVGLNALNIWVGDKEFNKITRIISCEF